MPHVRERREDEPGRPASGKDRGTVSDQQARSEADEALQDAGGSELVDADADLTAGDQAAGAGTRREDQTGQPR